MPLLAQQTLWLIERALVSRLTKQKVSEHLRFETFALTGAGERNRTLDLLITSELLYQLSYSGNLILAAANKLLTERRIIDELWQTFLVCERLLFNDCESGPFSVDGRRSARR